MNKLIKIAAATLLLSAGLGLAQTSQPADKPDLSRAQKQADNVFRWIKLHAGRVAPASAPLVAKHPAPAPAAPRAVSAGNAASAVALDSPAAAAPASAVEAGDVPASLSAAQDAPAPAPAAMEMSAAEPSEPPLNLIKRVDPELPQDIRLNERGYAQIKFTVEPDGRVTNVGVLKTSMRRLGQVAAEAVRQWRFEPVKTVQQVAIQFEFAQN